jgi:hypothetical protein
MKKLIVVVILGSAIYGFLNDNPDFTYFPVVQSQANDQQLTDAYQNRKSNLQVRGSGVVTRLLPDDLKGSRHQRFILRLSSGQTLLISHNIDLAPRINALKENDKIEFYGEYEWNAKGGVIHWTHYDPAGRHPDGWLKHHGVSYGLRGINAVSE